MVHKKNVNVLLFGKHVISVSAFSRASQGNITTTIIWFAISTGVTAGLSYYKEKA